MNAQVLYDLREMSIDWANHDIARAQHEADKAYQAALDNFGTPEEASQAYLAEMLRFRERVTGEPQMWLCPICRRVICRAGQNCDICDAFIGGQEYEQMTRELAHGG